MSIHKQRGVFIKDRHLIESRNLSKKCSVAIPQNYPSVVKLKVYKTKKFCQDEFLKKYYYIYICAVTKHRKAPLEGKIVELWRCAIRVCNFMVDVTAGTHKRLRNINNVL